MNTATKEEDKSYLAKVADEDPVVGFVYRNQRLISYIIIACLVALIAYRKFNEAHVDSQLRSADLLENVSSAMAAGSDEFVKMNSNLKTLETQKYPYNQLAENYSVIALSESKDYPKIAEKLKSLSATAYTEGSKDNKAQIWQELALLNLAKALLDSDQQSLAIAELKKLIQKGSYANVPAIMALESLSNQALSEEVAKLKQEYLKNNPIQNSVFE